MMQALKLWPSITDVSRSWRDTHAYHNKVLLKRKTLTLSDRNEIEGLPTVLSEHGQNGLQQNSSSQLWARIKLQVTL